MSIRNFSKLIQKVVFLEPTFTSRQIPFRYFSFNNSGIPKVNNIPNMRPQKADILVDQNNNQPNHKLRDQSQQNMENIRGQPSLKAEEQQDPTTTQFGNRSIDYREENQNWNKENKTRGEQDNKQRLKQEREDQKLQNEQNKQVYMSKLKKDQKKNDVNLGQNDFVNAKVKTGEKAPEDKSNQINFQDIDNNLQSSKHDDNQNGNANQRAKQQKS